MKLHLLLVTLIAGMAQTACAEASRTEEFQTRRMVFGLLTVDIHYSQAANTFHMVDQLSGWSEFCHRQYRAYFEAMNKGTLSHEDLRQLARHAGVRAKHSWGKGLEQTFYRPADIDGCLKAGVEEGHLTAEEAEIEREVLTHFALRAEELMRKEQPTIAAFVHQLQSRSSDLAASARTFARFCGCEEVSLSLHLIANPDERSCGGGYNGGVMTLEVPGKYDIYPAFLHEAFHVFLKPKQYLLEKAAAGVTGLDEETLNEGIAYAFSPGIVHPDGLKDPLAASVAQDIAAGKPMTDSYARFHRLGLALRPLLRDALNDPNSTLETFLPRAQDAWRVLVELESARTIAAVSLCRGDSTRSIFIFGPAWQSVEERVHSMANNRFTCNHDLAGYQKTLGLNAKPGDVVILLLCLAEGSRVPKDFEHLLPQPWTAIEGRLRNEESVLLKGKSDEMLVIVLGASTFQGLEELVTQTDWAAAVETQDTSTKPVR